MGCLTCQAGENFPVKYRSNPTIQSRKGEVAILYKAHSNTPVFHKLASLKQVYSTSPSLEKCRRLGEKSYTSDI